MVRDQGDHILPLKDYKDLDIPTLTNNACQTCRQRRKKCDGEYPCGPCVANNRTCIFTTVKKRGPTPRSSDNHSLPPHASTPPSISDDRLLPIDIHPDHLNRGSRTGSPTCSLSPLLEYRSCKRQRSSVAATGGTSNELCTNPSLSNQASFDKDQHASLQSDNSMSDPNRLASSSNSLSIPLQVAVELPTEDSSPLSSRSDLLQEVNVLSKNMTVVVSVDEQGRHAHICNHGHANALHLFRQFTRTFSPNARDGLVYVPDLVCCPTKPNVLAIHKILFPPTSFVDLMVEYFFDHIDPFLPFISRSKINTHLKSSTPSYILLYALLAVATLQFERRYRVGPTYGILLSHLLLTRAKELIQPILSSPTPCLLNIQALLLIEMADRESIRGAPWLISGMSIRMALDLGLNLGVPDAVKAMNIVSVPVWSKTWIYCCIVDSLNSFMTGRSHMISDGDTVQDLNECVLSKWSLERYGDQELILPDHFFVYLFKLFKITGKIGRTITNLRIRRKLPYSLPELHSLLSKYLSNLPKSLVYNFEQPDRNSIFAIHLNLLYLGTVIFLYRSLFACDLMVNSPLRFEYMRILESSTDAILAIFISHLDAIHLAPLPLGYAFDLIYTVCVILITQKPVTTTSISPSPPPNNDPGISDCSEQSTSLNLPSFDPTSTASVKIDVDSRNKPKAVRILVQCLHLLESLAEHQPLLRRHAALGKELLQSITGAKKDCDSDLKLLLNHLEIIKSSESRVQEWAHDPLLESFEAGKVFSAYLNVPIKRRSCSYSPNRDSSIVRPTHHIVDQVIQSYGNTGFKEQKSHHPLLSPQLFPSHHVLEPNKSQQKEPSSIHQPDLMAGLLSHAQPHQLLHDNMYTSLSHHHLFHPFALPIAGGLSTSPMSCIPPLGLFDPTESQGHEFQFNDSMMELLGSSNLVPDIDKTWTFMSSTMPNSEAASISANFITPLSPSFDTRLDNVPTD